MSSPQNNAADDCRAPLPGSRLSATPETNEFERRYAGCWNYRETRMLAEMRRLEIERNEAREALDMANMTIMRLNYKAGCGGEDFDSENE